MLGPRSRSTPQEVAEIACSSAAVSLPAPGMLRSMTNWGMTFSKVLGWVADRSRPAWGHGRRVARAASFRRSEFLLNSRSGVAGQRGFPPGDAEQHQAQDA